MEIILTLGVSSASSEVGFFGAAVEVPAALGGAFAAFSAFLSFA